MAYPMRSSSSRFCTSGFFVGLDGLKPQQSLASVAAEDTEKDGKEADAPLASVAVGAIIIRTRIVTMITIRIIIIGLRLRRRGRIIPIIVVLITTTPMIKTTTIIKGSRGKARTHHGQARRA